MSRIRISISRVDDDHPDVVSELATFDLPEIDIETLKPETALDDLEASTYEIGTAALKRVLQARWEVVEEQLVDKYRQSFPPPHSLTADDALAALGTLMLNGGWDRYWRDREVPPLVAG